MANFNINDGSDPLNSPVAGKKITFNFGTILGGPYRSITTTADIVDGNFHHVAGVVDPSAETIELYVDGVLQTVNQLSSGGFPSVTNTAQYTIGQANGGADFYTGIVDEVRIWNVVRTQTEIQNNMNTELAGTESGLVSYWKMDMTNLSCDVKDCNSNENHGTRNGGGGSNNLPQFSTDIPALTDVACGAATSCVVLPVELIDFRGRVSKSQIHLNWETGSELNNLMFEIEKSKDGKNWASIDFVEGRGTANKVNEYEYEDKAPLLGINYYRLKQVDIDGIFEYSKVITVHFSKERVLQLYPNPTNGKLQIDGIDQGEIVIVNAIGKTIYQQNYSGTELDISAIANGVYFLSIRLEKETWTKMLIKE